MPPLTRNEWLEMWATMQAIEYDMIHFPVSTSPYFGNKQRMVIKDTRARVDYLKIKIQSVLGQME